MFEARDAQLLGRPGHRLAEAVGLVRDRLSWPIEQIIRLTVDSHSLQTKDKRTDRQRKAQRVAEPVARLKQMALDAAKLGASIARWGSYDHVDFMQATTEMSAYGTWQDPDGISDDDRAENVILEMEYGETASEKVGDGIITTLRLINNLEINEQILYDRLINIEHRAEHADPLDVDRCQAPS